MDGEKIAKLTAMAEAAKSGDEKKISKESSGGMGSILMLIIFLVALVYFVTKYL